MSWYQRLGLETSFLYDLPNLFICILTVLVLSSVVKLPSNYRVLLLIQCFVPYFINDFLFSAMYLPDQFKYIGAVREIRSNFEQNFTSSSNVANASWILAFIPIPFVETVKSLGFANKLLFILTFFFLYKKNILTSFSASFLLLYPSITLYTGLSLRDTLIFCGMLVAAYGACSKSYFWFILGMLPLSLIKFQNFFLMLPLIFYMLANLDSKGVSIKKGIFLLVLGSIVLIVSFPVAGPLINFYRLAMYREDGGLNSEEVPIVDGITDFITLGLTSGVYFFIKPFVWEVSNAFQLIQSLENLLIAFLVIKLTLVAWIKDVNKLMFWLLLFVASMSIYGLVVFNYGTAARYRFPFIAMYVVFVSYSCNIQHIFSRKICSKPRKRVMRGI